MARVSKKKENQEKKVTRYTYDDIKEPRTPETGHTALLPTDEQVVTVPMDNGWGKAILVGKLPEGDTRPIVLDMDPAADPVLFWSGKRNKRDVPILPLQRNEIVSESRIAQIIERVKKAAEKGEKTRQTHLFADLEKSLREGDRGKRVEFYTHDEGWKNKLICGDSLQVMESLLHYENLRGKVQMIYIDPPYGISYDSNFQQRVDSPTNDEKDQSDDVLTIKAFRDTWALGVHSYLSYLQERLYLCRELLSESGSIFVQINDEGVHLVRALMDEVFGRANFISQITFRKKLMPLGSKTLESMTDYLLWFACNKQVIRYYQLYLPTKPDPASRWTGIQLADGTRRPLTSEERKNPALTPPGSRIYATVSQLAPSYSATNCYDFEFRGVIYRPPEGQCWVTTKDKMVQLASTDRLEVEGGIPRYVMFHDDFPYRKLTNPWIDTSPAQAKDYAVQTDETVIDRCILMTTNPGDLVFDPTCGSGTTSVCAERLGRRWITCDVSRVAINKTRQRLLSQVLPHYILRGESVTSDFSYDLIERTSLKSIANELEPQRIELRNQPNIDKTAIRITGPFEVMSLGRYSVEDWKGCVVCEPSAKSDEPAKLENYIKVICHLYRKDAAIQGATGLIHAVAETEQQKIAISVGPISGRVTAKQINDAVQDALSIGILEVHVLGWAFEANVGEVKSHLEKRGKVKVELIMIRPDTLAEGLKVTQPEMLFSPLALPDIDVAIDKEKKIQIGLKGVALFDRKRHTTDYKTADSGYISAWYLDEDYDGDCFVDCQMFFDFKKTPNIKAALKAEVDPEEFKLKLVSEPFMAGEYKRIAVKVVDVYGNESTVVRDLS